MVISHHVNNCNWTVLLQSISNLLSPLVTFDNKNDPRFSPVREKQMSRRGLLTNQKQRRIIGSKTWAKEYVFFQNRRQCKSFYQLFPLLASWQLLLSVGESEPPRFKNQDSMPLTYSLIHIRFASDQQNNIPKKSQKDLIRFSLCLSFSHIFPNSSVSLSNQIKEKNVSVYKYNGFFSTRRT